MRIIDARTVDKDDANIHCDVCIVGAGAAGIYCGARLAHRGLTVVVLEAGGPTCSDGATVGIEAAFDGAPYRGATEGRVFGLGGSTATWGGVLIPHSDFDIGPASGSSLESWRHIVETVKQNTATVLATLGLEATFHEEVCARRFLKGTGDAFPSCGLAVLTAEMLPFRRKNLAGLLKSSKKHGEPLRVFLHAVASEWQIAAAPGGVSRLTSVKAQTGRNVINISADSFVLAAGAIESARILLEMERQLGSSPFRRGAAVGRYLGDHLSCKIADVARNDWTLTARLFTPRFVRGQMRSLRFVECSAPVGSPRCFAHFIFENENPGFLLAKKLLEALQSRKLPKISLKELTSGTTGVFALGWDRVVRSRLYVPPDTPVHLQLDIEQHPSISNGIRLDDRTDAFGRPLPVIRWEVQDENYQAIHAAAGRLLALWPGKKKGLPELSAVEGDVTDYKPYDAYHPVGVCRMGTDVESVVDPELRVHGTSNLAVLSTAVFPSAGTANPTFSMLCLGEALAERLSREIARR